MGPYTNNHMYMEIFEEFYDFSDASNYKLTLGVSGVTFNGINPNLTFPQSTISNVNVDGIRFQGQAIGFTLSHSPNFTICVFMQLWLNRGLNITFHVKNNISRPRLRYNSTSKRLFLETNSGSTHSTFTNDFNGKRVLFWMAENSNASVVKVAISNYSSTFTQHSASVSSGRNNFEITSQDVVVF